MRMALLAAAALGAGTIAASPAYAQQTRATTTTQVPRARPPLPPSPAAQQAMQSGNPPDVLLDVPDLSVQQITLDVENLDVNLSLDARLANLLKLTAGADAHIDKVKLELRGVHAQATLIVRLDNVRAIIERTLQTLDNNPQLLSGLLSTVDNTVNTVGGITSNVLRNGQVLDLARTGLTELSRTVNGQGNVVHQVRNTAGQLLEVVTDQAGRILSSRSLPR